MQLRARLDTLGEALNICYLRLLQHGLGAIILNKFSRKTAPAQGGKAVKRGKETQQLERGESVQPCVGVQQRVRPRSTRAIRPSHLIIDPSRVG